MMTYEMRANRIALVIWAIDTDNGRGLNRDECNSHMENCHAAVANTYIEGMTDSEWHTAALHRLQHGVSGQR